MACTIAFHLDECPYEAWRRSVKHNCLKTEKARWFHTSAVFKKCEESTSIYAEGPKNASRYTADSQNQAQSPQVWVILFGGAHPDSFGVFPFPNANIVVLSNCTKWGSMTIQKTTSVSTIHWCARRILVQSIRNNEMTDCSMTIATRCKYEQNICSQRLSQSDYLIYELRVFRPWR